MKPFSKLSPPSAADTSSTSPTLSLIGRVSKWALAHGSGNPPGAWNTSRAVFPCGWSFPTVSSSAVTQLSQYNDMAQAQPSTAKHSQRSRNKIGACTGKTDVHAQIYRARPKKRRARPKSEFMRLCEFMGVVFTAKHSQTQPNTANETCTPGQTGPKGGETVYGHRQRF